MKLIAACIPPLAYGVLLACALFAPRETAQGTLLIGAPLGIIALAVTSHRRHPL